MQPESRKAKFGSKHRKTVEQIVAYVWFVFTVFVGFLFVQAIILGIVSPDWLLLGWWAYSGSLACAFMILSYLGKGAFASMGLGQLRLGERVLKLSTFKASITVVLVSLLLMIPLFSVGQILTYHGIAQSLVASEEKDYFRNLLGRNYNYTELYQWERSALQWDGSSSMTFYADPIEIYQYHRARCGGYAILYAELCISQGYEARIVLNILGDHVWNEVRLNGTWTRVDASPTGASMSENIGYPLFYEEKWGRPPLLALAFEGASVVDVTSDYRSDHWSLFSGLTAIFVLIGAWFAVCVFLIWKRVKAHPKSEVIKIINRRAQSSSARDWSFRDFKSL